MEFEIPERLIHFTRRWDFDRFVAYIFKHREYDNSHNCRKVGPIKKLSEFIRGVGQRVIIPDGKIGWYPFALKKGRELIKNIKPSVILAMGGPYTGLMVAAKLSKEFGIPWVADILDPWADNYSIRKFPPLSILNARLERKTLSSCSSIIVVTKPWAATLKEKYGNSRVELIYNAFDDEDFISNPKAAPQSDSVIKLVYTGYLYRGQVPEAFFKALRWFLDDMPTAGAEVDFYGPLYPSLFFDYVNKYRIEDIVTYHGQISYKAAIERQQKADVLLLFTWGAKGVLLAKTLSYIAAGRPILSAGPEYDTTAEFVKRNGLGAVCSEAEDIKKFLLKKYQEKIQSGGIPPLEIDESWKAFFTYKNQAGKLSSVLKKHAGFRDRKGSGS